MAEIEMPQLGETVTEGTITRWFKNVGDAVAVAGCVLSPVAAGSGVFTTTGELHGNTSGSLSSQRTSYLL